VDAPVTSLISPLSAQAPAVPPRPVGAALPVRQLRVGNGDRIFAFVSGAAAWFVFLLLIGIAAATFWGGREAIAKFGMGFVFNTEWDVGRDHYGALIPILGTLASSGIAMLIAVPTSFGIAVFLAEAAPRFVRQPIAIAVELLAAVPSIVYGMWGLFFLAPFMAAHVEPWLIAHIGPLPVLGPLFEGPPIGIGMLTAGIILAIMIIPFISSVMRDVFQAVPPALRESAFALGATPWELIRQVTLPHTRSAVVGAMFLGLGRALGETMAVTFVIGSSFNFSRSLLAPGNSMASAIANEFAEAEGLHRSALLAIGFLLFVVTFIVLALAKLMLARLARADGLSA
jgi:phosphate transport system permease protein